MSRQGHLDRKLLNILQVISCRLCLMELHLSSFMWCWPGHSQAEQTGDSWFGKAFGHKMSGWGWKAHLEMAQPNPLPKAMAARSDCSGMQCNPSGLESKAWSFSMFKRSLLIFRLNSSTLKFSLYKKWWLLCFNFGLCDLLFRHN